MVNKKRLQLALDALRSGEYQQGRRALAPRDGGDQRYCCLGVLCEVAIANGVVGVEKITDRYNSVGYRVGGDEQYVEYSVLPTEVSSWYGLDALIPSVWDEDFQTKTEVTVLNDCAHATFPQIADALQRTYIDVED